MNNRPILIQLILVIIGAVLFIPFLGEVPLFDWDEINFAESAREMIVTGDYSTVQINYQAFWEKPPLFIWMQVLSMKVFGINEFAARFPNALCGIISLLVLFNIGRKVFDIHFGLTWALIHISSILPFFYFKSGIIDPWFNLFIFLGIYYFILYLERELQPSRKKEIALSAFFIGLGILTKGPVALLIFLLCGFVYLVFKRFRLGSSFLDIGLFLLVLILVGGFWFILQIVQGNYDVVVDFVQYQIRLFKTKDAGHGGFFLYHFIMLLIGVFPASVLALAGFKRNYYDNGFQKHFKVWMIMLFWVVLILFTIVKTKIVHYSSLCYFPITFLAAYVVIKVIRNKLEYRSWITLLITIISVVFALVSIALPYVLKNIDKIIQKGYLKDTFAIGNLQADVQWSGIEAFIGGMLLLGIIFYIIYVCKKKYKAAFISVFFFSLVYINLNVIFITPRVEKYSQHAAIEFYQSKQNEKCYVETLGFKSYAHLFYTRKKPLFNSQGYDKDWLLSGKLDRNAYFVIKNNKKDRYLDQYSDLKVLYEKNGFIFTVRLPEGVELK